MNQNNIVIVENIRMIAASKKMNIAKIEKACGFANGTIGKWAKAPKSPPFDKITSIADCLGVYIGDIVGYDYNLISDEPSTPEIKKDTTLSGDVDAELKYIWNNIDDADREFLLANARLLMERRNKK